MKDLARVNCELHLFFVYSPTGNICTHSKTESGGIQKEREQKTQFSDCKAEIKQREQYP